MTTNSQHRTTRLAALKRSLRLYRRDAERLDRMAAFYRRFVPERGLAFDVGAHLGDRTAVFRMLGARVVAVEPDPLLHRALRLLHGRDSGVVLAQAALGAKVGEATLRINLHNPTVSTLSDSFIAAADGAQAWEGQTWTETEDVPVTTLDVLIAQNGVPDFAKIDVEGYEDVVLDGLSRTIPALSFEVTTLDRPAGIRAVERLERLGPYRYVLSLGESFALDSPWSDATEIKRRIEALPEAANSGDVYARLSHR
ncbi:MAG: FkbM family methyltransferase [Pseudomonadota bacterium]